jgi:hypothetical protein
MRRVEILLGILLLCATGCAGVNLDTEGCRRFDSDRGHTAVTVFPAHVNRGGSEEWDARAAERIATAARDHGWFEPRVVDAHVSLPSAWYTNEAKMLGLSADAFAAYVREHPIDTPYALIGDYLLGARGSVGGVHVIVVDAAGKIVDVSLWNSHWEAFQAVRPEGVDGCTEVALRGLAAQWATPAKAK